MLVQFWRKDTCCWRGWERRCPCYRRRAGVSSPRPPQGSPPAPPPLTTPAPWSAVGASGAGPGRRGSRGTTPEPPTPHYIAARPLLLAPFLAKELQKGPELQEAGGPASLLPERPRVRQGPQEPVLHLQELHLLPCSPPILPPDNTS